MGVLALFAGVALASCERAPSELVQGANMIQGMVSPRGMARSMFSVEFPDGTPSQYVSYLFSSMGSAEWPPSAEELDPDAKRVLGLVGVVSPPRGVSFVPRTRDPTRGMQLVLRGDDERGVVIAEGYVDPTAAPVLRREWKLPKVEPDELTKHVHRANSDLGMSSQAF